MTTSSLQACSHKDLAQMARKGGVPGWHSMRKDQLVKALVVAARAKASKSRAAKKTAAPSRRAVAKRPAERTPVANPRRVAARKATSTRVQNHLSRVRAKVGRSKNLASRTPKNKPHGHLKDRVIVMVRDPYWLQAYWEVTRLSVERAEAAMKQEWHVAKPYLRVLEVTDGGTTSASERVYRDIEIHGGVNNWYIHIEDSPKSFRVEVGYMGTSGRFFGIARSNVVNTPAPDTSDDLDENWTDIAENFAKIYAMSGGNSTESSSTELQELFEERLRRPMGSPRVTRYGVAADGLLGVPNDLRFEVDAEMIIYGATKPNAHVTLRGEPVRLRPDGSFTVRLAMPNQRQVIPVVACTADGGEQRTIVLAVERNTKTMEPLVRESDE